MSLTLLVGPTAVGKTVIWEDLILNHNFKPFKTYTTRNLRKEEQGIPITQYHFISREEFQKKIEENHFFEHIEHVGNFYGTSEKDIVSCISDTSNWVGVVDIKGAIDIKSKFPEVFTVFLLPPSSDELKRRLVNRNSESKSDLEERLRIAFEEEIPKSDMLDEKVVNKTIKDTSEQVKNLLKNF